ncbi:MAG: PAS domain S-box protein [Candidatus Omnitrophica bacterium]|nr:PAS domain S-box protein [Candidatus Omnitrophota bacterium]
MTDKTKEELIKDSNLPRKQIAESNRKHILQGERERKQTDEMLQHSFSLLHAIFDSTPDGILLVDQQGKIINSNKRFQKMWKIPESLMFSGDDKKLLEYVRNQLKNPELFIDGVEKLYTHHTEISYDILEFKEGKFFERYSAPQIINKKIVGRLWNFRDITSRKKAEQELLESKALIDAVVENVPLMIFLKEAQDLRFVVFNRAGEELLGYDRKALLGKNNLDLFPPEQAANFMAKDREVLDGEAGMIDIPEEPILTAKKGNRLLHTRKVCIRGADGTTKYLLGISEDITERKQAEIYQEMGREVMQILLGESEDFQGLIQRVLAVLKTRIGLDAVGIRLQDGDDFPYFAQQGFSEDFLRTENALVERSADGGLCRDKDGNFNLECTCGLVVSGKTDPANPYFTKGGSCWTNDEAGIPFQDTRLHPRDECLHQGYASVALVPIRCNNKIVGLIQLNDRRKGCFTLNMVENMEEVAVYIGEALMRKQADAEIKKLNTELEEKVLRRTSQFINANLELSKEITARKEYEEKLNISLAEKELLLKEVNHRVKNNLQTIAGILGLQILQAGNEEISRQLKDVHDRINSMALLQGMLHQAESLNNINFDEYINTIAANLSHSHMMHPAELEGFYWISTPRFPAV